MKPILSIIYVYYNTPNELTTSIKSVKQAIGNFSYEIIIVDNASPKPLPKNIKQNKRIKIIKNNKNAGYSQGLNIGADISLGKYLLFMNCDTRFFKNSIKMMIEKSNQDPKIGILGPQMLDQNMNILPTVSGFLYIFNALFIYSFINKLWKNNPFSKIYWLYDLDRNVEQQVDVVSGACMMMKKQLFEKIEGFDQKFFMYFEEVDICYRVKKLRYQIMYYPKAKIQHLIGKSTHDKQWISKQFVNSRYIYFHKHFGLFKALLTESFLRLFSSSTIVLFLILLLSAFLNLYKIDSLMMFIGDFGRDYLAAREMILTRNIPLVGIPSSVVWLHQGPLSIYIIGLAFILNNSNPVAPAIAYGLIGVFTTFLVYHIGKLFFNKTIGILSAMFFATSPLIVVNIRMPYHTSSIPFFSCIFFLILFKILKGSKNLFPLLFFISGLLLQVELSNAVVLFLLAILWFLYKPVIDKTIAIKSFLGFAIGILPFILFDFTHGFIQTLGFPLWILNRIRLFLGLTTAGNSTTSNIPNALDRIWQQLAGIIFPSSTSVVEIVLILIIISIFLDRKLFLKNVGLTLIMFWIIIPLIGFIVHGSPGTAYFPLIFPAISLMVGYVFYQVFSRYKLIIILFLFFCFYNVFFTIQNEYFLITKKAVHAIPPESYYLGYSLDIKQDAIKFILNDAKNRKFSVKGGGFLSKIKTGMNNYTYLLLYDGGKVVDKAGLIYTIYEDRAMIPDTKKILYNNNFIYIVKDEKNN